MGNSIKCSSCGACCRMIGYNMNNAQLMVDIAVENTDVDSQEFWRGVLAFPHELLHDGTCSKLGADGRCTIYEERPDVCRSEYMYDKLLKGKISEGEYELTMRKSCNRLMDKLKVPARFRV